MLLFVLLKGIKVSIILRVLNENHAWELIGRTRNFLVVNASFILFRGVEVYTLQETPDADSGGDYHFSPAAEHTVPQLLVMAQALRTTLLVCSNLISLILKSKENQ